MTFEELEDEALKLPMERRAELVRVLILSLNADQESDPEIQQAWIEEAERRLSGLRRRESRANSRRGGFPQGPGFPSMKDFFLDSFRGGGT